MISIQLVAILSLLYFAFLFVVAYYADRRRILGKSLVSNSHIYSLSLAVYCTSWTFYGSVGRAATSGLDFLAIYLGPTLMAFTWWFLLRKIIRCSKEQNIVSIADFISSRYGKSTFLGAVVTIFAVIGIMPYIALQLKAISQTFDLLTLSPEALRQGTTHSLESFSGTIDTTFVAAFLLGLFGVLFGARQLDTSERHEGLVAAIAVESIVKIVAFVSVGIFVTYGMFDGFTDIFSRFQTNFPARMHLLQLGGGTSANVHWFSLLFISMMAFMFLPRQFHILVIENSSEDHIRAAMWRFPAYLFVINLFVIPIALGGLLTTGGDTSQADYFVLSLPLQHGQSWLALLAFLGGFSAAAGMVMVSAVALSTMILNHLIMPVILKFQFDLTDFSVVLINLKRAGILAVTFLGYLYYRVIGESYALVNIGLISFIAATQFAPSLIGGLYWRRATRRGAATGLILGFLIWFYTLLVPSFVRSGWLASDILEEGLFGMSFLKPLELFGLTGFDIWSHSLFWSLFFNLGSFITLSLLTNPAEAEQEQQSKFLDVFNPQKQLAERQRISKAPTIMEFVELMTKFIGEKQAHLAIADYLGEREIDSRGSLSEYELPNLKRFTERTLAGSVGAAPARIIIENYLATRGSRMEDVFNIFGSVNLSRTASREQLGVLYEAAGVVASGADLQHIMDEILDLLVAQFKFDLCVIRTLDKDQSILTVCSQKGMSSEHLGQSERSISTDTYIGQTFLTAETITVNDTDFMEKPASAQIIHQEGIKSFAHAPIIIEGEPVGVLSAFSRSIKGIFTDEFIELFSNLSGQIGIAWRNNQQTLKLIQAREQQREMEIAKTIQLGLLPLSVPDIPGIQLAGICVPAREVGGDYYDFLLSANNQLDLLVADVSGHNVGSALLMAETRTYIRARAKKIPTTHQVMASLNHFFYDDLSRSELFITMFYLRYNHNKLQLNYASAGHCRPILYRGTKNSYEMLDAEGLIFGIREQVDFEERQTAFIPGDILLLYTDGLTEASNPDGELFGEDRLRSTLSEVLKLSPQEMTDHILSQVRMFTGRRHFSDDVSLVILKSEPRGKN